MKVLNAVKKVDSIVGKVVKVFAYGGVIALAFNIFIVVAYVIARAIGKPFSGTEEMVAVGQAVLISLAFAYTHYSRGLVHVGFFMKKLPGPCPMIAWFLDNWISVAICVLWFVRSVTYIKNVKTISLILALPDKPFYVIMTIGVAVYTISQLYEAIKVTIAIFNKPLREEIKACWPA